MEDKLNIMIELLEKQVEQNEKIIKALKRISGNTDTVAFNV